MTYLTMVARCGVPKSPANAMKYTLVDNAFGIHSMTGDQIAKALNSSKAKITNMAVSAKGLVSTNGALDKYTLFDPAGMIVGTPRCVILNRRETNGKLSGYVMYDQSGIIRDVSISEAVQYATNGLIANGKVRHTSDGDIVSSITGNYPLIEVNIAETKDAKPTIDHTYFGSVVKDEKAIKFAGVNITCKSAKTINKLYGTLSEANSKLCSKLEASYGYDANSLAGFAIRPTPGGGFYGVYPIDSIRKLDEAGLNKCTGNKLIVACLDKSVKDAPESIAIINAKTGEVIKSQEGTNLSDKRLKDYVKSLVNKY
jgi:hypothetical protein